uniref:Putative secreted protein n=1 Tax=Anopheles darlingi TaxID=43151 RepID=A0A2M4D9D3_ANODA
MGFALLILICIILTMLSSSTESVPPFLPYLMFLKQTLSHAHIPRYTHLYKRYPASFVLTFRYKHAVPLLSLLLFARD